MTDPLRASLEEQLRKLRAGPLPEPLLDVVSEQVAGLTIVRPRDWDELRHQEGGAGRGVPYWALLWPSGLALAEELAERDLTGLRVLELGCGLGAPSVVAAHRGAHVLATDSAPEAVVFAAHNLALNELEGDVAQVDWAERDSPLLAGAPWDLVIAADILYMRHNVEALARFLPVLAGPSGKALIADPRRAGGRDFLAAARGRFRLDTSEHGEVALHRLTLR
jgi:predicted nicotinamide N-methyase